MTPAQRWMILGGAVVVVVILGVFIFFWTRPPAPAAIELEGVVARASREGFTLSEVTVFSGPQPCSLERLTVQVESRALLPSSPLQPGDLVTVKGEYHANENIDTDTPDVVFAWVTVPHTGDLEIFRLTEIGGTSTGIFAGLGPLLVPALSTPVVQNDGSLNVWDGDTMLLFYGDVNNFSQQCMAQARAGLGD
jgi:hypothetical protein